VGARERDWFMDALVQQGETRLALAHATRLYGVGDAEAREILARMDER
jgi:hypothetical protein